MTFNKQKYDNEYAKEKYDKILLTMKKGDKEKIKKQAEKKGYVKINPYIRDLIYKDLENENKIHIGTINQSGTNNSININQK